MNSQFPICSNPLVNHMTRRPAKNATQRPINRRFAATAFGEGYGDMTPAQRAARKAWLEDSYTRERQLVDTSGLKDGFDMAPRSTAAIAYDAQDTPRLPASVKLRESALPERRTAYSMAHSARCLPLFNRAALDSLLYLPEDAAHVVAKKRFACVPRLAEFRLRYRQRVNVKRSKAVDPCDFEGGSE